MVDPIFDAETWSRVPFHFWSVVFFVFGSMVGSFLNVCIYRMPLGLSVVSPPSHCPHCKYSIPWFLNMPLVTWLLLRGKCKSCGAPIPTVLPITMLRNVLSPISFRRNPLAADKIFEFRRRPARTAQTAAGTQCRA